MTSRKPTFRAHGGFALPMTLILLAVAAITVGGVVSYVSFAARQTRIFSAKDTCRFAAQSAIEFAKEEIQNGFNRYTGGSGAASVKIDPRQAEAYNWFDEVSADRRTIGKPSAKTDPVTLSKSHCVYNGCEVWTGIGEVIHEPGSTVALVPLLATASYDYPDGLTVTATIREYVAFGTGQSQVFDYAYFVNNYGWMNGSGITINGDMRANGDVSLSGSVVNGFIYAAENDEVGATGGIRLSSSPKIHSRSQYRSNAGNRARYDTGDYDVLGAYDAPASTTTITKPTYDMYGNVRSGTVGATSGDPIVNEGSEPIPMPFVSDLGDYVEYAQEKGGTLRCGAVSYTDGAGATRSIAAKSIAAHYSGVGPSGDPANADNGALVLVGTQSNPIVIDGPVVVDSDVIIKGYVKGQGTIYSGRNIHIIGDVKYLNAPTWLHGTTASSAEAQDSANSQKDMLGLVAKGNIVVGDCSQSSWRNSILSYINGGSSSVVESYACDPSDQNIGYASTFAGSYASVEATGSKAKLRTQSHTETYYDAATRRNRTRTVTELVNQGDRKYYETCCDDAVLTRLKDTAGVSQIDAILYNNHGIFGTIGKANTRFNLNGSIVCRDEALVSTAGNGINFNWDMRLKRKRKTQAAIRTALPVGPQDPYTYEWGEVPDELNFVYCSRGAAGGGKAQR